MDFPDTPIAFIIPAFNEEDFIGNTIDAIRNYHWQQAVEIIVIDNGSTDHTQSVAKDKGAELLVRPGVTIATLRNIGVDHCKAEILVFLDADVCLTTAWFDEIPKTLNYLNANPSTITGSRCLAPANNNWLNKYWFNHLSKYEAPYINSGHLITTRKLFIAINGFNDNLVTAEDHDFCSRAKKAGAEIYNNPKLKVIHYGYPTTVGHFIRRERWHGREDFETLSSTIASKVALIALFNLTLLITALFMSIILQNLYPILAYAAIMYICCIALSKYKFRFLGAKDILQTASIFFLYLQGRALSFLDRIFKSN